MIDERHVSLFRNGRNQAVRIPREFELEGTEAIIRKEGGRLIIEPVPPRNGLLALLTWIAFHLIGLENAGAWALTSGLLHVIPYFGSILMALAACLIAYVQFGTISMALLVAGVSIAIATLVGTVVTTWMTGRITRMNAAAVFISLLFWGWLWGAWGLLLGVPIIVIVKVVAEHVDGMQTVAELLSE